VSRKHHCQQTPATPNLGSAILPLLLAIFFAIASKAFNFV
jgi:hypothetical protein